METQDARKKVPRRSLQQENDSDIEKRVDEILNAHSEVLRRGKEHHQPSVPTLASSSYNGEKKQPSFFFITSKKKGLMSVKPGEKEQKPTLVKEKKHFGFGKKKKE